MSMMADVQTWLQIKHLVRMYANDNSNSVQVTTDDFGLTFGMDQITIRLFDKVVNIDYTNHFMCDLERILELLVCNLNEDFVNNPHGYIWLDSTEIGDPIRIVTNEEKCQRLEHVNINVANMLLVPYIDQLKRCNEMHWAYENPDIVDKLTKITNNYNSVVKKQRINGYDIMGTYGDGMFIRQILNFPDAQKAIGKLTIDPAIKLFYHALDSKTRAFFLSDLLKMPEIKLRYVVDEIKKNFYEHVNPIVFIYMYETDTDNPSVNRIRAKIRSADVLYKNVIASIPNHIEKFPFFVFENTIPSLTTFPKTNLNWLLTLLGSTRENLDILLQQEIKEKKRGTISNNEDMRIATNILLPYINCSEKVLELYCDYISRDKEDQDGAELFDEVMDYIDGIAGKNLIDYMNLAIEREFYEIPEGETPNVYDFNEKGILNFLNGMLNFIDDGEELYKSYPEPIHIEDAAPVKLVPVEGTLLKRMRNSIYNHREEQKISIEDKLKALHDGEAMESDVVIPDVLKPFHIFSKRYLIFSGKELGHCIGGKTNSHNIFVRRGNICAEISYNRETFVVSTCLDAKNQTTDESKAFKDFLTEALTGVVPVYKEFPNEAAE